MIYLIEIWDSCGDVYKLEVSKPKPGHNKQTRTHREEKQEITLRFIFMALSVIGWNSGYIIERENDNNITLSIQPNLKELTKIHWSTSSFPVDNLSLNLFIPLGYNS